MNEETTYGILTEMHPRTDEEILAEFDSLGGTASYHYADDSGKEWRAGDRLKEQALALVKAHPELRDGFLRIGERFLWSFGLWLETYEKRLGRRIDEAPLPPKAGQAGGESAEVSSEGGQGLRPNTSAEKEQPKAEGEQP